MFRADESVIPSLTEALDKQDEIMSIIAVMMKIVVVLLWMSRLFLAERIIISPLFTTGIFQI